MVDEIATPALPARLAAVMTSSVQSSRSATMADNSSFSMSRPIAFRRLEGVDHRDGATSGEEADDCGGVREPVADHETDGCAVGNPGVLKPGSDGVGVSRDVVAGVPAAFELDALLLAVAREACRELFGKALGHG